MKEVLTLQTHQSIKNLLRHYILCVTYTVWGKHLCLRKESNMPPDELSHRKIGEAVAK